MPEIQTLLLFAIAALALTATPGPDMMLIASRSAAQGRRIGFATWGGAAVGTYIHALAAAFGLSQLFISVPMAYDVVRMIGAIYLLYLAWVTFTVTAHSTENMVQTRNSVSAKTAFSQGVFTNVLNPKMVLFVLALFPQFVDITLGAVGLQIMVFASIINVVGFFVNGAVILVSSQAGAMLSSSKRVQRFMEYVLAAVFVGLAVKLVFDEKP